MVQSEEDTHVEYAILDKAGRLQVPRNYLETINVRNNKVKLELEEGKIIMTSDDFDN
ncbi:hypothetical protein D3C78_710550 [compost metagenome]